MLDRGVIAERGEMEMETWDFTCRMDEVPGSQSFFSSITVEAMGA